MAYLHKRKERLVKEGKIVQGEYTTEERIQESGRRRAMIEYVMLEGDTSSFECAHQLGKLCENRHLVVNLIPYNPTNVKDQLQCPSEEHMAEFRQIVASYGAFCTIRRTMGQDIDSACGQLITQRAAEAAAAKAAPTDIEDVATPLAKRDQKRSVGVEKSRSVVDSKQDEDEPSPTESSVDWDRVVQPLAVATAVAAGSFLVSTALFLKRKR